MRPQQITIMCFILFAIGASLALRSISIFFLAPGFFTFIMVPVSLLGLYCYYGLWNLKSWSIPLFYGLWIVLPMPMFLGVEGYSTISILRSLYYVAVIAVFTTLVIPHKQKFS